MKVLSSTKIAIGFVIISALLFGGYRLFSSVMVRNENFTPVKPGSVNLVGIDPGSGYRVIVANQMAQLVQASEDFEGADSEAGGATEGSIKKRIPIREMLGVLQGDSKSLGSFAMIMNDIREGDQWPTVRVVWTADNLRKALDGDPELEPQLVRDLNMKLDGTPLPTLRPSSLENGIIVEVPVTLKVNIEGKVQEVTGPVQQPYRPRMMKAVEALYADKQVTREMQAGYYAQEARKAIDDPAAREDIRKTLESMISTVNSRQFEAAPERVLKSATVVVSDAMITGAEYKGYDTNDGKRFDLTIRLTDEGRKRLWKYSLDKVGSQLLLIANGVAIAAPRISHELAQGELTIRGMTDEVLVRDAVEMLAAAKGAAKS